MTKSFSVEVTVQELELLLKNALKSSPHSEILTKIIIHNLDTTQVGIVQLFKALNGIDNETKWKVGMNVLVNENNIYSSSIDKPKMKELGMIHKGWIKAHITSINIYNSYPVTVDIIAISTSTGEEFTNRQTVPLDSIVEEDQWPEFHPIKDDLPF